jgi:DNA-binding CsgD family transcriptional regulator
VPNARFVPLEGRNHVFLTDDPAWRTFLAEFRSFLGVSAPTPNYELAGLSGRELQIVKLVADGLSNEEIAARLYLSIRTVERHLSNVYRKLDLSGKAARAAVAARQASSPERSVCSSTTCYPTGRATRSSPRLGSAAEVAPALGS